MKIYATSILKLFSFALLVLGSIAEARAIEPAKLIGTYKASNCLNCFVQIYPDANGNLRADMYPWDTHGSLSNGPQAISMVTSTRMMFTGVFYDIEERTDGEIVFRLADPKTQASLAIGSATKMGVITQQDRMAFAARMTGIYQTGNCAVCMVKVTWDEKTEKLLGDMQPWNGSASASSGPKEIQLVAPGVLMHLGNFYNLVENGFTLRQKFNGYAMDKVYMAEKIQVLTGPTVAFDPRNLEKSLEAIGSEIYPAKKVFLEFLAAGMKMVAPAGAQTAASFDSEMARLFVLNAIQPFMNDVKTKWFEESILPAYGSALATANGRFQVTGLSDIPITANVKKMAVVVIQAGIESAKSLLASANDRTALSELQTASGRAIASPMKHADTEAFINAYDKCATTFEALSKNPRMQGVGVSVLAAIEYLKKSQ